MGILISFFLIGAGAVGGSLAVSLVEKGAGSSGVYDLEQDRAEAVARATGAPMHCGVELPRELAGADVVLLAVPERAIGDIAEGAIAAGILGSSQVWLHVAGSLSAEALGSLRGHVRGVGCCHPAHVFPPGEVKAIPSGVAFTIDGDGAALDAARELVSVLEGRAVELSGAARPAYHAATVIGSNYLVALLAEARGLLVAEGLDDAEATALLVSLAASAVVRAGDLGLEQGLSGPIRRGDAETVRMHLDALGRHPDSAELYRSLGRATLRLVRRINSGNPESLDELERLLDE